MTTGTNIHIAVDLLNRGEVVAIPTETVYGLAANAYDPEAILKIFSVKNRPKFNPLIVHIPSIEYLHLATPRLHPILRSVAEVFWPGPLTVLSERSAHIHELVTAGSELVAIRVPDHPLTRQLLHAISYPLAAPSANMFGKVSPTSAQHVADQLGNKVSYILDGGNSVVGVESTIIKLEDERVSILRHGGITASMLAEILGYEPLHVSDSHRIEAPGMLRSHYAPSIPLFIGNFENIIGRFPGKKIAVLNFISKKEHPGIVCQFVLSPSADLHEAAKNLFTGLHELEKSGADMIISDPIPNEGIGVAINDRLKRASA